MIHCCQCLKRYRVRWYGDVINWTMDEVRKPSNSEMMYMLNELQRTYMGVLYATVCSSRFNVALYSRLDVSLWEHLKAMEMSR
jgi:hypothetical protein